MYKEGARAFDARERSAGPYLAPSTEYNLPLFAMGVSDRRSPGHMPVPQGAEHCVGQKDRQRAHAPAIAATYPAAHAQPAPRPYSAAQGVLGEHIFGPAPVGAQPNTSFNWLSAGHLLLHSEHVNQASAGAGPAEPLAMLHPPLANHQEAGALPFKQASAHAAAAPLPEREQAAPGAGCTKLDILARVAAEAAQEQSAGAEPQGTIDVAASAFARAPADLAGLGGADNIRVDASVQQAAGAALDIADAAARVGAVPVHGQHRQANAEELRRDPDFEAGSATSSGASEEVTSPAQARAVERERERL